MSHPLDALADNLGPIGAILSLGIVTLVALALSPGSFDIGIFAVAIAAWVSADVTLRDVTEPPTEIETERRRYVDGDIDLDEFEERAELILDERAQQIRDTVERVGGVGPSTSASIASEFDDIAAVRVANIDELTAIYGIGESTATAIIDEIGVDAKDVRESHDTETATDKEAFEVIG